MSINLFIAVLAVSPNTLGVPLDLTWKQLDLPKEIKRDFSMDKLPAEIRTLDGKVIRIRGDIYPASVFSRRDIDQFVLCEYVVTRGHEHPEMDAAVPVKMKDGYTIEHTSRPINVSGRLAIKPLKIGSEVFYIYRLNDCTVESVEQ